MKHQSGQVLLIAIMLLATVLTVVLAVTFKSTTETQITRLEEESQKALSAAEAGVEAALQKNIGESIQIPVGGFTGEAKIESLASKEFVSPILQKDQQYTFYLSDYPGFNNPFTVNGNLILYLNSEGLCPALELTFISQANAITRRIADPCNQISNGPTPDLGYATGSFPLTGYTFIYQTDPITVNPATPQTLLIVRTLFASTRVGLKRTDAGNLPNQGKYVTSEAKSLTGVSKKVQLFQSFPQIPAEFFVTSF